MDSFPIFMRLRGREVLVVGTGAMAHAKQRLLIAAGARVDLRDTLPPTLAGYALVFGANGDDATDRVVAAAARDAHLPVNVVDRPELSDFIMPAVVDRGDVVIGISTGGASPILAQRVRGWIEDALPVGLDRLAAFARRFRAAVQTRVADNATRRRFWERFFDGEGAALVMAGEDIAAARRMIRDLNVADADERGKGTRVEIELISNDPDDLTLGTLRALRKADVILHDGDVSPAILDYARRDARHVVLDTDHSDLTGLRVVVLRSLHARPDFTSGRAFAGGER
jgi:uroporphyrin-III C-methyltransferase/precorrin-2 dehydrogenase/sirohydrochlorin ferrochelatase